MRAVNEALQYFIGKKCVIAVTGLVWENPSGIVKAVNDNWLTIETGKPGEETISMINTEQIRQVVECLDASTARRKKS